MPCGAELAIGWIPVQKTIKRDDEVHTSDHIDVHVRLLPILEPQAQDDMLREELELRGWARQPDGSLTKPFGDAVATLPAGSATIRLEVEHARSVTASGSASGSALEADLAAQDEIVRQAEADADRKLAEASAEARATLVKANIDRLLRVEQDLRAEVAEVAKVTTKRSLEQRAAQLGAVESTLESRAADGSYELTITVKT